MTAHARLSASGAERWMACPPSIKLSEGRPDTASQFAAEGTLAHAVAELKLQKYFTRGIGQKTFNKKLEELKTSHMWEGESLWQPEMQEYTDMYFEYIKNLALSKETAPCVSIERRVDFGEWVPDGFGTADCILISGNKLHIIDLKYGKGIEVSAENNAQLMLYALGAYNAYKLLYNIDTFVLTIVQPRKDNISEWEISLNELLAFGERAKEAAALADKGEGEFNPGEHCRFCKARAVCRARADKNIELLGFVDLAPDEITNDEIGDYLEKGRLVADWLKNLEAHALNECLAGNEVAGWKAVEGTSRRAWTDIEEAFKAIIASGIDEAILYERKPLTLAQVEKVIGKKDFEAFKDFVKKPPGKPTLVEASDKRPAISNTVKANDVFTDLGGQE